jgi:hypothetical protein
MSSSAIDSTINQRRRDEGFEGTLVEPNWVTPSPSGRRSTVTYLVDLCEFG